MSKYRISFSEYRRCNVSIDNTPWNLQAFKFININTIFIPYTKGSAFSSDDDMSDCNECSLTEKVKGLGEEGKKCLHQKITPYDTFTNPDSHLQSKQKEKKYGTLAPDMDLATILL